MVPLPPSPVVLSLTVEEADALLQVLLESPVPDGIDEAVVNDVLVQLAESLPGLRKRRTQPESRSPVLACR